MSEEQEPKTTSVYVDEAEFEANLDKYMSMASYDCEVVVYGENGRVVAILGGPYDL
jgi:hypothetical protein